MSEAGDRIRAAAESDAPELARLCTQLGYPVDAQAMVRRLRETRERVFVAERAESIEGFIVVEIQRGFVSGTCAEIGGLVVDEHARGRGVGARLLAFAEVWASESGISTMRVHSNRLRERAHAFYQREGYEIAKTQHVFVKTL